MTEPKLLPGSRSMRHIAIHCELVCDHCGTRSEGSFYFGQHSKRQLIRRALDAGWNFDFNVPLCGVGCVKAHVTALEEKRAQLMTDLWP